MTISERIFERLDALSMTQKDFSGKTGIRQRLMGYEQALKDLKGEKGSDV